jgi:transcriptional regulator of arginine metabolism
MKQQRHAAILRIIQTHPVHSQEQLRRLVRAEGFRVTQATLSRDLRELRLVKVTDPDGAAHYAAPPESEVLHPPLEHLLPTLLLSLDGVEPRSLLVLRTPAGSANALASALDAHGWEEMLGTLAGDDTILLITRSERARRAVAERLQSLAGMRD